MQLARFFRFPGFRRSWPLLFYTRKVGATETEVLISTESMWPEYGICRIGMSGAATVALQVQVETAMFAPSIPELIIFTSPVLPTQQ